MSEHVRYPSQADIERLDGLDSFQRVKSTGYTGKIYTFLHTTPRPQETAPTQQARANRQRAGDLLLSLVAQGYVESFSVASKKQRMHKHFDFRATLNDGGSIPIKIEGSEREWLEAQQKYGNTGIAIVVVNPSRQNTEIERRMRSEIKRCRALSKLREIRYNYTLWQDQ